MKRLAPIYFLSILLLTFSSTDLYAKEFRVCTVEIPDGMTEDKIGPQPLFEFYQEVTKIVSEKTQHSFNLIYAPAERCLKLFIRKEIDILWPFIISEDIQPFKKEGYPDLPIYSMPIIMGGYYVFTRETDPKIDEVKELEGKSVVSARGYGIPKELIESTKVTKSLTNSNEHVPKMILGERVDAGVIQTGWVPTLERQGLLKGLHHGEIIEFWGGSFTFHFSHEGNSLSNVFSNTILKLVTQGKYKEILTDAPYYIPNY